MAVGGIGGSATAKAEPVEWMLCEVTVGILLL